MNKFERDRLLTSQIRLRRIVGSLGIGLPFVLSIASFVCMDATMVKCSISAYYGSEMRDIFVGIMCVIGVFLFAYKGYDAWDDRASHLAGVSAVGVALFPVTCDNGAIVAIHYLSATVLFLTLAYISRYRFTRSSPKKAKTESKRKRNLVYKWCAYVMIFGLIAIGAFKLSGLSAVKKFCLGMNNSTVCIVFAGVLALMLVLFVLRAYFLWVCYRKEAILYWILKALLWLLMAPLYWILKALRWLLMALLPRILKKRCFKKLGQVCIGQVYKWCIFAIFFLFAIGVGVWAGCYLPGCLSGWHRPCTFVFAIEFVMLMAFGLSWIVKGDTLWSDEDDKQSPCCSQECCDKKCCDDKKGDDKKGSDEKGSDEKGGDDGENSNANE